MNIATQVRMIGAVLLGSALALRAELPVEFEVASIKLSDPASAVGIRRYPGGRFVTSNASLRLLIAWAYDIGDERLTGAQGWLDSARFDITAKAPTENPTLDDLHTMMKALLAERFKLRVHTDKKELPMYALVADKSGPKVRVLEEALAMNHDPFNMTQAGRLTGRSVTTAMLAKALTHQVRHFVRDDSGFHGAFDFTLEWRPDGAMETDTRPSLFTAIREQLGFALVSGREQVEVIAIDHVERHPTEN